jgi:molybdate transport system substrate-binding protein
MNAVVFVTLLFSSVTYATSDEQPITLFAASSLTVLLPEVIDQFEQEHQAKVRVVYAGSGQLARQIQYGARADLFISANKEWSDAVLSDSRLVSERAGNFVSNHMVVVRSNKVPPSERDFAPRELSWWQQELSGQRLAIGEPSSVPVGMYAKQSLAWYGLWDSISSQLAPTNSTRNALALVERGQTPIGIVYASDATNSDAVTILGRLDAKSHSTITYPMILLGSHDDNSSITKLVEYFLSATVQQQFKQQGFES